MPKLYEYMGIVVYFYSEEHEPIHVHAKYGDSIVKVSFFLREGKIYRTTYANVQGQFSPSKLRQLKALVKAHRYNMVERWIQYIIRHQKVQFIKITRKL